MKTNVNPSRPLEELVGDNRGIVRMRISNLHCMTSRLEVARRCRPRNMRKIPVELRRGWAKCVLDTLAEFRGTYLAVANGTF